jgi:hypothetical protein
VSAPGNITLICERRLLSHDPSIHFTARLHVLHLPPPPPPLSLLTSAVHKKGQHPLSYDPTMTIPPNDAFTLTSHSDSTPSLRSSRSRSITRSPSPKITFTTSQHASANCDSKRRPSRRHRKSNGFVSDAKKLADVDEALERALNGNAHANGIANIDKVIAPTTQAKKIDWEIPRKVLHSSIGKSRDSDRCIWAARPPSGWLTASFQDL